MTFTSPTGEYRFILDHIAGFPAVAGTERFAEATPDLVDAILTEAGKLCDEVLAPLQRNGDLHPAVLENGVVRTSPGFADGFKIRHLLLVATGAHAGSPVVTPRSRPSDSRSRRVA